MQELQQNGESASSNDFQKQKEHYLIKLKRLTPGLAASLNAMHTSNGLSTEPADLADSLREHWGEVFRHKPVNLKKIILGCRMMDSRSKTLVFIAMILGGR